MAKLKDGFYKQLGEALGNDDYVLLAGGGSKLATDFIFPTKNITPLTGYKIGTNAALSASDSLNTALGKLEFKATNGQAAYDLVQAAYDGDGKIENLKEILKVLEGLSDKTPIKDLLGKYLPLTGGTLTGNLTINNSEPVLTFLRGTTIDGSYDWRVLNSGGYLKFQLNQGTDKKESWLDTFQLKNNGIGSFSSTPEVNGTKVSLEGHTHNYAGSSSAGGSANSAMKLEINNDPNLSSCLQYIQTNKQTDGLDLPPIDTSGNVGWRHIIKMNHGTGDTYYKRLLAFNFTNNRIQTNYATGDGKVKTWETLAFLSDIPTSLPANGGTASALSTKNKTIWGQTYWDANGKPTNVTGDLTLSGSYITGVGQGKIKISSTAFQYTNQFGYVQIGPMNSSHCHFYTDMPSVYFDKPLIVNGINVSMAGHKHSYTDLTGSGTVANQVIVSNGTKNEWTLKTLGGSAFTTKDYSESEIEFNTVKNKWVRVAESIQDFTSDCSGEFDIMNTSDGNPFNLKLFVTIDYVHYASIIQIYYSAWSGTPFDQARIIYKNPYGNQKAYLELRCVDSRWIKYKNQFLGKGWQTINPKLVEDAYCENLNSKYVIDLQLGRMVAPLINGNLNGTAEIANKLGTNTIGKSTTPIYLSKGTATVCEGQTVPGIISATTQSHTNQNTNQNYVPDMSFISYWNGAYDGKGSSNLKYCNQGAFGSIATKAYDDYLYRHQTSWDFTKQHLSNVTSFDVKNCLNIGNWVNGFVSTHSHYLSSYIVNIHRLDDWYLGWGSYNGEDPSKSVVPNWKKILHSGNSSISGRTIKINDNSIVIPTSLPANGGNANTLDGIDSTGFARIFKSTIKAKKGIRITFGNNFACIISVRGTTNNAGLLLIGNGYGENLIRNTWTQLASSSYFHWKVPPVDTITRSIEIFSDRTADNTDVNVICINTQVPTFTEISYSNQNWMDDPVTKLSQIPSIKVNNAGFADNSGKLQGNNLADVLAKSQQQIYDTVYGGVNYYDNYDFSRGYDGWGRWGGTQSVSNNILTSTAPEKGTCIIYNRYIPVTKGEVFTASADVRSSNISHLGYTYLMYEKGDNQGFYIQDVITSTWKRIVFTFTVPRDGKASFGFGFSGPGSVQFKNMMWEKGETHSDPRPSYYDIKNGYVEKLGYSTVGSASLPIYLNSGTPTACTGSSVFSQFANSGNDVYLTIAGQQRSLTVGYASNAGKLSGLSLHSGRNNEKNKVVRTDNNGYIQCGYINSSSGHEKNNSNPSYVWGSNSADSYLRSYKTSALSVNHASSAGSAGTAKYLIGESDLTDINKCYAKSKVAWYYRVVADSNHYVGGDSGFPSINNSNGVLSLGTHAYGWGYQLGFSSDENIYMRYGRDGAFANTANGGSWAKILTTKNFADACDVTGTVATALSTTWRDVSLSPALSLSSGTYIVQVSVNNSSAKMTNCYFSGIMSWWDGNTTDAGDAEGDEIILHRAGQDYDNTIYLRTVVGESGKFKLQIAANTSISTQATYTFKFKKLC